MADIAKAKRNVEKMIGMGAPETDIDAYLASEGLSAEMLRSAPVAEPMQNYAPEPKQRAESIPGRMVQGATEGLVGIQQNMLAGSQRTSPVIRTIEGEMNYEPLGELVDMEGYAGYKDASGAFRVVNPNSDVVLRDPASGKQMVFARNPEMNEGRIASLGRVMAPGFLTSPPTRLPGGAPKVAPPPPAPNILDDFAKSGVDPSLAATGGKFTRSTARNLEETMVGGPLARRSETQLAQAANRADDIASSYGAAKTPEQAGRTLKEAAARFQKSEDFGDVAATLPSRSTSFGAKEAALWNRVDEAIPDQSASITLAKTAKAFREGGGGTFTDDALRGVLGNPRLKAIADRLDETGGKLSYSDARSLRTTVRGMMKDPAARGDIAEGSLKRIYAALSDDLKTGVEQIGGPQAATAYRRANQFTRAGMERWDRAIKRVFNTDSPEKAYEQLISAAQEGKSADIGKLTAMRSSLRPDEWDDVASTVISGLGKPKAGVAGMSGPDFSASTFLTNYSKLSPRAKDVLFRSNGRGNLADSLDSLSRVTAKLKELERSGNPSRSGTQIINALMYGGAGAEIATTGLPVSTLGAALAGYSGAQLLQSPRFVRALSRLAQASAQTSNRLSSQQAASVPRFVAEMRAIAQAQPELAPALRAVAQSLQGDGEAQAIPSQ